MVAVRVGNGMQDIPPVGNFTPRGNVQMASADLAASSPLIVWRQLQ